jgi:hypothetical protein
MVTPRAHATPNISPAAIYRLIEMVQPTLLFDEAQSMNRRGSESSEVIRELFNASIDRNAKVIRCGGANHDKIESFSVYSPKVIALIGNVDGVLADRCLPVELKRKTKDDQVEQYRSRSAQPIGAALRENLEKCAKAERKRVATVYDKLEPFPIENDRMAELLLPLMTVAIVDDELDEKYGIDELDGFIRGRAELPGLLDLLRDYALGLDARDREQEMQSPGVRLLLACKEIFGKNVPFMPTDTLIECLAERREEPWHRWNKGEKITREALANLLRPYGIAPERNKEQTARGYFAADFVDAWERYLPPPARPPEIPSIPAGPSTRRRKK